INVEEHGDAWVEVRKPRLKAPPKPPAAVCPWIDPTQLSNSALERAELRAEIVVERSEQEDGPIENGETRILRLADHPDVLAAWATYLVEQWMPWAMDDRRLHRVLDVYTNLFTMYQRQQRLGEAFEIVLGQGCLVRSRDASEPVKRHLITARASIAFDAKRGVITVGPVGEGARPILEQDMLEPDERPEAAEQAAIEQQLV